MSYDPQPAQHPWQRRVPPAQAKAIAQSPQFDSIRAARLAILFGLFVFWTAVIMALF